MVLTNCFAVTSIHKFELSLFVTTIWCKPYASLLRSSRIRAIRSFELRSSLLMTYTHQIKTSTYASIVLVLLGSLFTPCLRLDFPLGLLLLICRHRVLALLHCNHFYILLLQILAYLLYPYFLNFSLLLIYRLIP